MYELVVAVYLFIALLAVAAIAGLWVAILAYHRVKDLEEQYDELADELYSRMV